MLYKVTLDGKSAFIFHLMRFIRERNRVGDVGMILLSPAGCFMQVQQDGCTVPYKAARLLPTPSSVIWTVLLSVKASILCL